MNLRHFAALAALALGACNNNTSLPTPPPVTQTDSGMTTGNSNPTISVTGSAEVFPPSASATFYGDAGLFGVAPPSVVGRELHIDEPLLVILNASNSRLADTTIDDAGDFSAPMVPTDPVVVGMVATIVGGDSDGGFSACEVSADAGAGLPSFCTAFSTSASTVYEGAHPANNITGAVAYGVPVAFEEFLSAKLGLAAGSHLIDQGFVIGYVIDQNGHGVAGVTLDTSSNTIVPSVQYLDDNYNPVSSGGSNSDGIFLIVAPGSPNNYPVAFNLDNADGSSAAGTYGCHKLGSNTNSVFVLVFNAAAPGSCTMN